MGHTGKLVSGTLLVILGVVLLLNGIFDWDLNFGDFIRILWPVTLILLGVWLLARRRPGRLQGRSYSRVFGDITVDPGNREPDGIQVDAGFGDVRLDVTRCSYGDKEHHIDIQGIFGDVKVIVPRDLAVRATASNIVGDAALLDQDGKSFFNSEEFESADYRTARRKLNIEIRAVIGDIRVSRAEEQA